MRRRIRLVGFLACLTYLPGSADHAVTAVALAFPPCLIGTDASILLAHPGVYVKTGLTFG